MFETSLVFNKYTLPYKDRELRVQFSVFILVTKKTQLV